MSDSSLFTVAEAAKRKKVTTSAIYAAVRTGRLPHRRILGHIAIEEAVLRDWHPVGHKAGRPKGIPVTDEVKKQISLSQKSTWASGKRKPSQRKRKSDNA